CADQPDRDDPLYRLAGHPVGPRCFLRSHRQAGAAFLPFGADLCGRFSHRRAGSGQSCDGDRRLLSGGRRGLFGPCHLLVGAAAFSGRHSGGGRLCADQRGGQPLRLCRAGPDGLAAADDGQLSGRHVDVHRRGAGGGAVHGGAGRALPHPARMTADPSDKILSRAAWRLIPFMSLMYVVSFLDRVNISFAALTMNHDLGFSPQAYGIAAGIFFWGYFFFEVPSNLMLQKVGARLWMCRICVTWGLLSAAQAFVKDPVSFSILRFLLGAAEAGLYPGMVLYMTYWFPSSTRARFIALFLGGVPLSVVIGGPVSGFLLGVSGHGLAGWQWMLILEGIPSLLCGLATLWVLPDGPAKAAWLSAEEKQIIAARLAAEPPGALHSFKETLLDPRIWLLMIPDFSIVIALYGLNLWQPQMVKALGYSNLQTGFIVA